jgi:prepilin-type N-terminal cleavage/methylation domain-containing protein
MKKHLAFTLVELLVVLSASSIVLTISTAMIHRTMHVQSRSRQFYDIERSALRLSEQFRHDVHLSQAASIQEPPGNQGVILRLELPEEQIVEYSRQEGTLHRILLNKKKPLSRQEYPFPATTRLTLKQLESPARVLLSMVPSPEDEATGTAKNISQTHRLPVSFQAEAVLGRQANSAGSLTPEDYPK